MFLFLDFTFRKLVKIEFITHLKYSLHFSSYRNIFIFIFIQFLLLLSFSMPACLSVLRCLTCEFSFNIFQTNKGYEEEHFNQHFFFYFHYLPYMLRQETTPRCCFITTGEKQLIARERGCMLRRFRRGKLSQWNILSKFTLKRDSNEWRFGELIT